MNLTDVIEGLVEERGLDRDQVVEIVREGIRAAYEKRFPEIEFTISYNNRTGAVDVMVEKEVVTSVQDDDHQITVRRARVHDTKAKAGSKVLVPFADKVGRIEIVTAKQVIASKIKELECQAIYDEYIERQGSIISGTVHKREFSGHSIKIGEVMALLPKSYSIPEENLRVGAPVRAVLREVLPLSQGEYQLILDRATPDFVQKLLALEIPEVFEGIVEIKKIARIPGYKTKIIVMSNSPEIDPVGTCVGVGGVRIKPILKELGREKIDLIGHTEVLEELVRHSLKPAEIDKVEIHGDGNRATVWLAQDQRSYAIGKMGQNIALAARLTGVEVQLQDKGGTKDAELELSEGLLDLPSSQALAETDDQSSEEPFDTISSGEKITQDEREENEGQSTLEQEGLKEVAEEAEEAAAAKPKDTGSVVDDEQAQRDQIAPDEH